MKTMLPGISTGIFGLTVAVALNGVVGVILRLFRGVDQPMFYCDHNSSRLQDKHFEQSDYYKIRLQEKGRPTKGPAFAIIDCAGEMPEETVCAKSA